MLPFCNILGLASIVTAIKFSKISTGDFTNYYSLIVSERARADSREQTRELSADASQ